MGNIKPFKGFKKQKKTANFTITIIPSGLIEKGTNVKAGITSKNAKG